MLPCSVVVSVKYKYLPQIKILNIRLNSRELFEVTAKEI